MSSAIGNDVDFDDDLDMPHIFVDIIRVRINSALVTEGVVSYDMRLGK